MNRLLKKILHLPHLWFSAVSRHMVSPRFTLFWGEPLFFLLGKRGAGGETGLPQRILVVFLAPLGDTVMFTPFLRELRRSLPHSRITLIVVSDLLPLLKACPYVDEAIGFPVFEGLFFEFSRHMAQIGFSMRCLWGRNFDWAINPWWTEDFHRASCLVYLSGAVRRTGYAEETSALKKQHDRGQDLFFTERVRDPECLFKHEVEKALFLLAQAGIPAADKRLEVWSGPLEDKVAAGLLELKGPASLRARVVALGIGSKLPKRTWPVERYREVAAWLVGNGFRVVVLGSEEEYGLGQELASALSPGAVNLAGRLTLPQVVAVLKRCSLFIGNDSGPMHLAAAAGLPVIEISCHPRDGEPWHYNSPLRYGPLTDPRIILQPPSGAPPCRRACEVKQEAHCILQVGVGQVKEAARKLLGTA